MGMTLSDILTSHQTAKVAVMGVLNVTSDSFSDGGRFLDAPTAIEHARQMIADGADAIDVGAESTRPGSSRVPAAEQIARLRDVMKPLASLGVPVSIDTTRAEVARFALDCGAQIINDVSAGRDDPQLLPLAAERDCAIILMHMLGEPATMQKDPHYDDVVTDVRRFLAERLEAAGRAGVPPERCIIDPGIGFGKRLEHNLALLGRLNELSTLDRPIMVGPSRKAFVGVLSGEVDPSRRAAGTIGACLAAVNRGATIVRVHDVAAVTQALRVSRAIDQAGQDAIPW